jgi:moderate conductance mechanosensitive channel
MSADRWAALHDAIRWFDPAGMIALILIGAAVALRLSVVLIRRTLRAHAGRLMDEMRWQTLEPLMERAVRFVVYFTAFIVILQRLNVDVTAILASAGVVGVAIGLGAQHMVRDILAGIALLSEGLVHVGDEIIYETHTGIVERVGIRTIQIRTSSGEVWTIPNGRLEVFGNRGPQSGPHR